MAPWVVRQCRHRRSAYPADPCNLNSAHVPCRIMLSTVNMKMRPDEDVSLKLTVWSALLLRVRWALRRSCIAGLSSRGHSGRRDCCFRAYASSGPPSLAWCTETSLYLTFMDRRCCTMLRFQPQHRTHIYQSAGNSRRIYAQRLRFRPFPNWSNFKRGYLC